MIALLLAAGRGRRLGAMGRDIPKCLIRLDGRSLLSRHLAIFRALGIERALLVLGYRAEDVHAELALLRAPQGGRPPVLPSAFPVETVFNEEFQRGNILSLATGLAQLPQGADAPDVIVMDADVLYPKALFARLAGSAHRSCVLLDRTSSQTGEEMMVGVRGGRVARIARPLDATQYDVLGETVGFLKVAGADLPALRDAVAEVVAEGGLDNEYETAYERFVLRREVGFEAVDDLPWTEIDFPEDVVRAEEQVLPEVRALDGGPV